MQNDKLWLLMVKWTIAASRIMRSLIAIIITNNKTQKKEEEEEEKK